MTEDDKKRIKKIVDGWCDYVIEQYPDSEEAVYLLSAYINHDINKL